MKDFIDFIIYEDKDDKFILRFNIKNSHVHGFTDKPPKTWKEVYKVYYSYSIIEYWKEEKQEHVIYEDNYDECSVLYDVWYNLQDICTSTFYGSENEYKFVPMSYGTTWIIKRPTNLLEWEFQLFQSHGIVNKGCCFSLDFKKMKELKDTIKEFLDCTLENSEGI